MINKLRTRLTLLILGGTIFSILLVSLITNFTLFNRFDQYRKSQQENQLEEVIQLITESYRLNNGWTQNALDNILVSPYLNRLDLLIKDEGENVILNHTMGAGMMKYHNEMMGRMRRRTRSPMMDDLINREDYQVRSYPLSVDNQKIGSVEIGYVGPFTVSERDVEFTRGMNKSIMYAAIISILVALVLGIYSAKGFLKPILLITEGANNLRWGKLDTKVEIDNQVIELQQLSQSINHLATSLEEQKILRKRLTSDISHELRTPLTILQSHIEAIRDGIWEPTEEKLSICKNEVDRLIKLVGELQNLTDIEKHQIDLQLENCQLSKVIDEVFDGFAYQFQQKQIMFKREIQGDIYMNIDPDKMKQIIINLLSNALKFTDPEGSVSVSLKEEADRIRLTVEDTGIGIESEDIPYVFERFYRGDQSRNRSTGGAGIGLTITRSLVEAHQGTIFVESEKKKGTKFTVILPR
ncbi:integral membrane sensor signal transduction histidine kinase [Alkaliphilus metalliredigens QYMF]|uniref:histidine kinase n=1 Tax=Alkaliphilus metalliredigens (strain QYMF) TaxID=293826 RepID=A6TM93_ALKMQ|nr:ATP-binding protein [Alkaliphilus metalliredigens]ABR47311.1 integral membrane sensor signal transduction histidine kinase [Alkaliphilus metalliredigens QYMF]